MNKRIKTKWLKALRSGEYKQDKHSLNNNDKFCCLGVLCDLHANEYNNDWGRAGQYLNTGAWLPEEVIKWAGLDYRNPLVESKCGSSLIEINDVMSFKQIANIIEKQL